MTNKTTATFRDVYGRGVVNSTIGDPSKLSDRLSVEMDWRQFESYLQESDWPDDQKREFIETIWQIVVMFVDLGFGIESGQLALREALEGASNAAAEPEGGSSAPALPSLATREGDRE